MFFRRKKTENTQADAPEKEDSAPVCIIGCSPLAIYLAVKLQNAGEKVTIATLPDNRRKLRGKELSLKEEYSLQKYKATPQLTSIISVRPKLIIIAAGMHDLRSHLTLLPSISFSDTPIVCFSDIYDLDTIRPLFGINFCKAVFNGFLENTDSLTLIGSAPSIAICGKEDAPEEEKIRRLFEKANISVSFTEEESNYFWEHFAVYALRYLASSPQNGIAALLKNKEDRKNIFQAAKELELLAKAENVSLPAETVISRLMETPVNYNPKTGKKNLAEIAAETDLLYTILMEKARIYKNTLPQMTIMFKDNYNQLLKK